MALVALLQQRWVFFRPERFSDRALLKSVLINFLPAFVTLLFHGPSKPSISAIHIKGQLSSLILPQIFCGFHAVQTY